MTKLAFIGIDVGTSGIKALAVDLQGNILASHNEHLNIIIQKPGWTEQNPLEWLREEDNMPMINRLISDTRLAAVIGVAIAVTAAV